MVVKARCEENLMICKQGVVTALVVLSVPLACCAQTPPERSPEPPAYCVVDTGQKHVFGDRGQLF